jgi:hypothetical protein
MGRSSGGGAWLLAALLSFLSLGWLMRVCQFPHMIGTWLGLAEQLALITGALAIAAQARMTPAWLAATTRMLFGGCQLIFAAGHFLALAETVAMTPAYLLGGPHFWAVATGVLHLAGGLFLLVAFRPILVTRCLAAMFAAFGILVWLPMAACALSPASIAGNLINLALIGAVLAVGDAIAQRLRPPLQP